MLELIVCISLEVKLALQPELGQTLRLPVLQLNCLGELIQQFCLLTLQLQLLIFYRILLANLSQKLCDSNIFALVVLNINQVQFEIL